MKLIIGLGNIGAEYQNTRHNIGFLCLDKWAASHKKRFSEDKLFSCVKLGDTVLIKPGTYMNRSGLALKDAMKRWSPDEILAVYDDLELPLAEIRIRNGGGDGGHNGVKSLLEVLPPDSIKRIRIGIGKPEQQDITDYVLAPFLTQEVEEITKAVELAAGFLDTFCRSDFNALLNEYSKWKKSYSGRKDPES